MLRSPTHPRILSPNYIAPPSFNPFLCPSSLLLPSSLFIFPLPHSRGRTLEDTIGDKDVERLLVKVSGAEFRAKTTDSLLLGREVGNMYCASLYGGIASLFAT